MTHLPLAAGIGIEGIIWIIILIFWSIAQYMQKAKAAQRRQPPRPGQPPTPPPPAARPPTQVERDLQDLLRELTGQPPIGEAEEELPEIEPEPVRRVPPPAPAPARQHKTLASTRAVPPPVTYEPAPSPMMAGGPSAIELSEGMSAAFARSGKMPGMALRMRGMEMKTVSLNAKSTATRSGGSTFALSSLRHPGTLRKMVIARMVLDKPKALESSPGH